jgi:transposase
MQIGSFQALVNTERKARLWLRKRCWQGPASGCPRCAGTRRYRLGSGRYRCAACRYTFGDFTARWLGQLNLSARQWLWVVKLFELEVSTRRLAHELQLSYPTALKATRLVRLAILAQDEDWPVLKGELELDESYFGGKRKGRRGRGAAGKIPVFGILERHGRVKVQTLPDVRAETLLNATVKTVKRGSLIYTDKFRSYDALMCCGYRHLKVDHAKRFARGRVHINGLEGFWSYAKERLIKHHGVAPRWFPLYLKEMEFRYNHRQQNLFDLLINFITQLVPNSL